MYEVSFCSNDSSEYELNADTLDHLYKEQLQALRDLVIKHNQSKDIELCRKWLKVFSKTSKAEKMARNCLCSLMQQQLLESGTLSAPFTNLQNCNRDLERVLRDLDDQSLASANYTERTDSIRTFTSHQRQQMQHMLIKGDRRYEGGGGGSGDASTEYEINQKQTENVLLRRELETLRLQLTEKQIENAKLKEIAEKYQLENDTYEDVFDNIKNILQNAVKKSLQELESISNSDDQIFPFKIFESIFYDFAEDEEFVTCIKSYDTDFQGLLTKLFEKELYKRKTIMARHINRKYSKSKSKIREKYERRVRVQSWAQRLQLKLVKLKCFSALRQIFINTQSSGDDNMWKMLKVLEEKYQSVVSEIS